VLNILSVSVALLIQHAREMRPMLFSSVACPALPYFFTYLIKGTIVGKMLLNITGLVRFSLQIFLKHLSFHKEFKGNNHKRTYAYK
jgi:hypothetical protein